MGSTLPNAGHRVITHRQTEQDRRGAQRLADPIEDMQQRGFFVDDGKRLTVVSARFTNPCCELMRALSCDKGWGLPGG